MSRKTRIIARILLGIYILVLAYLCLGHFDHMPNISKTFLGLPIDKVVHFCMFLPFPVLAFLAYDRHTETPWSAILCILVTFLLGAALAGGTELLQGATTHRSAEWSDFLSDCIALAVSCLGVLIYDLSKMKR